MKNLRKIILCLFVVIVVFSGIPSFSFYKNESVVWSIDKTALNKDSLDAVYLSVDFLRYKAEYEWEYKYHNLWNYFDLNKSNSTALSNFVSITEVNSAYKEYVNKKKTDFKYTYNILDIKADSSCTVITVFENISFRYLDQEEDSTSGDIFEISLKKDDDWKIIDISTPWNWNGFSEYKEANYDKETMLQTAIYAHDQSVCGTILPAPQNDEESSVDMIETPERGTVALISNSYIKS